MDWDAREREMRQALAEERERLMQMSGVEADKLPAEQWYLRMRYLREVEAAEWLDGIRRSLPVTSVAAQPVTPVTRRSRKIIYNQD